VAAGTKKRKVLQVVVFPVAVDVLDLDGYALGYGMTFRPTASRALVAVQLAEDATQELSVDVTIVAAICEEAFYFLQVAIFVLTTKGAIPGCARFDFIAAFVEAPTAKFLWIHACILSLQCANSMAHCFGQAKILEQCNETLSDV
jgi:hypothetical protein